MIARIELARSPSRFPMILLAMPYILEHERAGRCPIRSCSMSLLTSCAQRLCHVRALPRSRTAGENASPMLILARGGHRTSLSTGKEATPNQALGTRLDQLSRLSAAEQDRIASMILEELRPRRSGRIAFGTLRTNSPRWPRLRVERLHAARSSSVTLLTAPRNEVANDEELLGSLRQAAETVKDQAGAYQLWRTNPHHPGLKFRRVHKPSRSTPCGSAVITAHWPPRRIP